MRFKGYATALLLVTLILVIPIVQSFTYGQKISIGTQTITNVPYFYVDNNISDVDSNTDIGTHSNFGAQQQAPDSIYDTLSEGMGDWFSGWDKRVRSEIDNNDIDNALSDFPILIHLSNSSGRNIDDVSFVFDEIQSDANRKKIAVTTSDGTTQCYVEIEKWDDANEQAWLWVKVPNVNSTADTDLYLYYDADQADNTDYVGDPGSTPAENVWDSDYVGVWHLSEASGDAKDSTSHGTDGTISGAVTQGITGQIDGAYDFRNPATVNLGDPADGHLDAGMGNWTVSWWMNVDVNREIWENPFSKGGVTSFGEGYGTKITANSDPDAFNFIVNDGAIAEWGVGASGNYILDTWEHWVGVVDRGSDLIRLYKNGVQVGTNDISALGNISTSSGLNIGGGNTLNGTIAEFRISNTNRSAGWIKANYESESDDLLDFGSEESESYQLDLEVQWTNVDYSEANEELCIYLSDYTQGSLDATGGYMIVGDGSPDWGSTAGTISFWVKMDSSVQGRFYGQHGDMETRWSGSNLVLDWGGTASMTSVTSFSADVWYFVAIAWDETNNDLFLHVGNETNLPTADANSLNGTWTSTMPSATENRFLKGLGGNEPVDGHGDDLRYYNVARDLAEIQSDYNVTLTGSETNLRSYFRLNNNFDDIGPDNNDGLGSGSYSFSTDAPFSNPVTESIRVDVWTGSSWQNVFTNLSNGWNNATVVSYLTSSTLTIRFKGNTETSDSTQDSWNIDSAVIHAWT